MEPVISAEQATWILQGAVSILLAGRDAEHRPSLCQALACRFSRDRCRITLFVPAAAGAPVLRDVRANGELAVTFTNSRTVRSIQVKARGVTEMALAPGDDDRITASVGTLVREWTSVGLPEAVARALLSRGDAPCVALEIAPYVAFDQTPGPRAGSALPVS